MIKTDQGGSYEGRKFVQTQSSIKCFKCQKSGHLAKDCRSEPRQLADGLEQAGFQTSEGTSCREVVQCECKCHEDVKSAGLCMFDVQAQVEECIENGQLVLANGMSMTVLSGSCKRSFYACNSWGSWGNSSQHIEGHRL